MQVSAIYDALANQRPRSAWERGVVAYAESMLDELEPTEELWAPNHRESAAQRRAELARLQLGRVRLIYDTDIARRLCSPSELRRCRDGARLPNAREEWLDTQARACLPSRSAGETHRLHA